MSDNSECLIRDLMTVCLGGLDLSEISALAGQAVLACLKAGRSWCHAGGRSYPVLRGCTGLVSSALNAEPILRSQQIPQATSHVAASSRLFAPLVSANPPVEIKFTAKPWKVTPSEHKHDVQHDTAGVDYEFDGPDMKGKGCGSYVLTYIPDGSGSEPKKGENGHFAYGEYEGTRG